jgi:subtilisin family serine protease
MIQKIRQIVARRRRLRAARAWRGLSRGLAWMALTVLLHSAQAQIRLPNVQVPQLPVDLPVDVNDTLSNATDRVNSRELLDLRRLQIRALLGNHRDVVERDPRGQPAVRAEITALSPSDAALARARAAGFSVIREKTLEGLDEKIIVLQGPPGVSTRRALRQLRDLDPQGTYDYNHIYTASGATLAAGATASGNSAESAGAMSGALSGAKVGLIDGGVDIRHAVFRETQIRQYGCDGASVPSAHGTAVASLLAGRSPRFHGALPGSVVYAADVYCGKPTGGAVDAVADALAWLSREKVSTINISLVGPPNVTLQSVIRVVIARGHIVVAAVGNDGPSAPPLYPAAYPDVIGVTGVDSRQRVLVEAARGKQVDFAAPGADMAAADVAQSYAAVRGTSFAAPIVAGLLAAAMDRPDKAAAGRAIAHLMQQAVDLGSRGRDSTYGSGLVGNALRMEPALAKVREE